MKRIIRISEQQLREIEGGVGFEGIDPTDDTTPFDGNKFVSVQGKLNGEENGRATNGDEIGSKISNIAFSRYRSYGNLNYRPHETRFNEGVEIDYNGSGNGSMTLDDTDDYNGNGVDDFYDNAAEIGDMDVMSDGNEGNNITRIPASVNRKANILLQALSGLNSKQKAMVINAFMEQVDISNVPYSWKKDLMYKVLSDKDNPDNGQIK